MKQKILIAFIVVVAFSLPVLAMSISPTRDAILGLAPEESILKLADEIDKSRIENKEALDTLNTTVKEQQSQIETQEQKIQEYESKLGVQQLETTKQATDIQTTQKAVETQASCSKIYGANPECQYNEYLTKASFDSMIKNKFKDGGDLEKKEIKRRTDIFNKCEEIRKTCP